LESDQGKYSKFGGLYLGLVLFYFFNFAKVIENHASLGRTWQTGAEDVIE
jgi:hypothetical protein